MILKQAFQLFLTLSWLLFSKRAAILIGSIHASLVLVRIFLVLPRKLFNFFFSPVTSNILPIRRRKKKEKH